jgi:hypothetical protein
MGVTLASAAVVEDKNRSATQVPPPTIPNRRDKKTCGTTSLPEWPRLLVAAQCWAGSPGPL